ncbi:hypothetical protein PR048_012534 [Dryococelus australis]|uniref:Uncharacterized protein n=1 Tax=Dryococelus australis TaxID=614101 RepID=A0ABQ9HPN6_9NEOP|nr:hypothetical protein PR048_012534 [Dryococelus australis]
MYHNSRVESWNQISSHLWTFFCRTPSPFSNLFIAFLWEDGRGRMGFVCRLLFDLEDAFFVWSNAGTKGRGKREIPGKTRRPTSSSVTIPTCENPDYNTCTGEFPRSITESTTVDMLHMNDILTGTVPSKAPATLNIEVFRADEGDRGENGAASECKGGRNGRYLETRRPAASYITIPTCENPGVTRPGIEPCLPLWETSSLTAQPPRPVMSQSVAVSRLVSRGKEKNGLGSCLVILGSYFRPISVLPRIMMVEGGGGGRIARLHGGMRIARSNRRGRAGRGEATSQEMKRQRAVSVVESLSEAGSTLTFVGAAVAERLACLPFTKANRVQSSVGPLPDFCMWESCRTTPLVGGFSRGPPVSLTLLFRHCSILTSLTLIDSQGLVVKGYASENSGMYFSFFTLSPDRASSLLGVYRRPESINHIELLIQRARRRVSSPLLTSCQHRLAYPANCCSLHATRTEKVSEQKQSGVAAPFITACSLSDWLLEALGTAHVIHC